MASPPQIPTPETRVGRYHLREKIGQTAAADLFRAVLPGLGGFEKRVVLKQLRPDLQTVPEHEARFVAQAKRAAAAHHPHLVQTFELLRDPVTRCMFAVMEDVEGPSLAELLDRTKAPLPAPVAVWVAASILDALAHLDEVAPASELGRSEVSPEQVRLSWRGDVKLGDYGLASEPDGLHLRGRTAYMSPEHLAGLPRDSRSEVFSVGAVLWEMLTGRRLFAAATLGRTTDLIR
ncbi:MAG: protein kinase, partial [Myxococcales bacterium]|nr:protein kinase [Myxococcales bacterium]